MMSRSTLRFVTACVLTISAAAAVANAQRPIIRNIDYYVIVAQRRAVLRDIAVNCACGVGVNCPQPSAAATCGVVEHSNASYDDGSQIVGDRALFVREGASVWQLFANFPSGLNNVIIRALSQPFVSPIFGDADGDGNPSCAISDGHCVSDPDDLEVLLGFPDPFPDCGTLAIVAQARRDCLPVNADAIPGNGRCDLAAGTYGAIVVEERGSLSLLDGDYAVCSVTIGPRAHLDSELSAVVDIADGGVTVGDLGRIGPGPGLGTALTMRLKSRSGIASSVTFGRDSDLNVNLYAPTSRMFLGSNNNLTGRFVGDEVFGGTNNRAFSVVIEPCGDGVLDPDEQCDPGMQEGCALGFECGVDCSCASVCGDGILAAPDETCDPDADETCGNGQSCVHCDTCLLCPTPNSIPSEGGSVAGRTEGFDRVSPGGSLDGLSGAPEQTYLWTPGRSGRAVIQTCSGTQFDTILYVRTGDCGGPQLVVSDDDCGRQSRLFLDVVAGETYTIVVDGYSEAQGTFRLDVIPPPP